MYNIYKTFLDIFFLSLSEYSQATHEAALAKYSELSSSALALTCLVREINPEVGRQLNFSHVML